uniref:Uncharacterized protein n=1 Tax=viral metagenome TaxID=1070528 RepID=A0A6M3JTN7_9ZZZZ
MTNAKYFPETTMRNGNIISARLVLSSEDAGMRANISYKGVTYNRANRQRSLTEVAFFAGPVGEDVELELT